MDAQGTGRVGSEIGQVRARPGKSRPDSRACSSGREDEETQRTLTKSDDSERALRGGGDESNCGWCQPCIPAHKPYACANKMGSKWPLVPGHSAPGGSLLRAFL